MKKILYLFLLTVALCGCGGGNPDHGGDEPVVDETVFKKMTDCGVYRISGDIVLDCLKYIECENQYSTYSNVTISVFSIVDMDGKKAVKVKFPNDSMALNSSYQLTVNSFGLGIPDGTVSAELVKCTDSLYWFLDGADKLGFIVSK